jgi:chorismate dehydratase
LESKIKVGSVSYSNAKPLIYGLEQSAIIDKIDLSLDYPAQLVNHLKNGSIDVALMPVAAIPEIPNARIVGDYGIATDGNVVSVALFSQCPIEDIQEVLLDYQSRTSVRLTQLLFKEFWKKNVSFLKADIDFIQHIKGVKAGVIIGDRALEQLDNFPYVYDLSKAWKTHTGLDFIFAAWVATKNLPKEFIKEFNLANQFGVSSINVVASLYQNMVPYYNLELYYKNNICYALDDNKRKGLDLFLEKITIS